MLYLLGHEESAELRSASEVARFICRVYLDGGETTNTALADAHAGKRASMTDILERMADLALVHKEARVTGSTGRKCQPFGLTDHGRSEARRIREFFTPFI